MQTARHNLIFDAGAKWREFDMGENVVIPFLQTAHIKKIDLLVVSHGDNDHAGGAKAILNFLPVNAIKTSVPDLFYSYPVSYCLQGQQWDWDNVHFEFLYPPRNLLNLNNDSSCVLRISNSAKSILLTGDIERAAEKYLHESMAKKLSAAVLIVPHHGSKTSAMPEFLNDVSPEAALFSLGYRNRYHFPHSSVIARYDEKRICRYDTVNAGAIQILLTDKNEVKPMFYRQEKGHYWNRSFSIARCPINAN